MSCKVLRSDTFERNGVKHMIRLSFIGNGYRVVETRLEKGKVLSDTKCFNDVNGDPRRAANAFYELKKN
jgi:hypothetical protein